MIAADISSPDSKTTPTVLSEDQQRVYERLVLLGEVRAMATDDALPMATLRRWSVPFLVGPASIGKGFVCEEVARRLGNKAYRRWDIGSWIIVANRSGGTTLEQIQQFVETNPAGCVIYLSGVDTLVNDGGRNSSYHQACFSEVEHLLDVSSSRPAQPAFPGGKATMARMLVIVGGRFSPLWGESELGGPSGADGWKIADDEPLTDAKGVGEWIEQHSEIPSSILRRLALEPLVLRPMSGQEADRLAASICERLPPLLDGIDANELAVALRGPKGWRAVNGVIESAYISGHDGVPEEPPVPPATQPAAPKAVPAPTSAAKPSPAKPKRPARLADKLLLPSHRSTLLPRARRVGLLTAQHLESLARSRGYSLPGDDASSHQPFAADVWKEEFSDLELALALLSPGLEYSERTICRGSLMLLRVSRTMESHHILFWAQKEHSIPVVRHIAALGRKRNPDATHWKNVLTLFPKPSSYFPEIPLDALPDEAIEQALSGEIR